MKTLICSLALLATAPLAAQTTQTPAPVATPDAAAAPASELTEAEQKTLKKCMAMTVAQQGQSSKCSKVMVKAGKPDPATARAPASSDN